MKRIFLVMMVVATACKPKAKPGEACDGDPPTGQAWKPGPRLFVLGARDVSSHSFHAGSSL